MIDDRDSQSGDWGQSLLHSKLLMWVEHIQWSPISPAALVLSALMLGVASHQRHPVEHNIHIIRKTAPLTLHHHYIILGHHHYIILGLC